MLNYINQKEWHSRTRLCRLWGGYKIWRILETRLSNQVDACRVLWTVKESFTPQATRVSRIHLLWTPTALYDRFKEMKRKSQSPCRRSFVRSKRCSRRLITQMLTWIWNLEKDRRGWHRPGADVVFKRSETLMNILSPLKEIWDRRSAASVWQFCLEVRARRRASFLVILYSGKSSCGK